MLFRKRDKPYSRSDRNSPKHHRPHPPPPPELELDSPKYRPAPPEAVVVTGLAPDASLLDLKSRFEIYSMISRIRIDRDELLVSLVRSFRFDGEVVDTTLAYSEVAVLYEFLKAGSIESDRSLWVLSTRNVFQLRETFEIYHTSFKNTIEKDIKSRGKGDFETVLLFAIRCIHKSEEHFAKVIREAVVGLGTDEDALTRAIVTRAEVDMVKIKSAYTEMYNSTVEKAVTGDTSGDYEAFLMTLLGAR